MDIFYNYYLFFILLNSVGTYTYVTQVDEQVPVPIVYTVYYSSIYKYTHQLPNYNATSYEQNLLNYLFILTHIIFLSFSKIQVPFIFSYGASYLYLNSEYTLLSHNTQNAVQIRKSLKMKVVKRNNRIQVILHDEFRPSIILLTVNNNRNNNKSIER